MRRRDVRRMLESRGIHPRTSLGQNFLTDTNLLLFIVRTADVGRDDIVLEVGSGTAGLSVPIAKSARRLVTVEIDPILRDLAAEQLALFPNVTLLHEDVLADKHHIAPNVLAAMREALAAAPPNAKCKLVANLPYSIATPLIIALLESDLPFERLVCMVQREVGERLAADPGSRVYGAPTVLCALHARVSIVRTVRREVFWPRPKVESAILDIRPRRRGGLAADARTGSPDLAYPDDYAGFVRLVRALFAGRRKKLRTLLKKLVPAAAPVAPADAAGGDDERTALGRDRAEQVLVACGIDPEARSETLSWQQVTTLANALGGGVAP